jgi:hypothetical protein
MTHFARRLALGSASLALGCGALVAHADGRNFNDGPVINVSAIRTVDGKFDEYMAWLDTAWKKQEEALKKAGLVTAYRVLLAEPHGPNEADVYLVIEYKNWAALDGLGAKADAISGQIEGSPEKANQAQYERAKIRTVLGSETMQVAELK